ncbi:MAG: AAA family ATPase [Gammaproteobacteria bacterium]|nr:AAA family ATPase [Gammaproteobacteria bacterium]
MAIKRILVCNAKGGCGKTTIATNIASHFAAQGKVVRLFDHDMQGSSLQWASRRGDDYNPIHAVDASRRHDHHMTRSWQLRVPLDTEIVVIDTPAGIDSLELASMFQENDYLIMPVLPSPIDIHAAAYFIKDMLLIGKLRKRQIKMAVVANRVRKNTLMYHTLERFLFSLNIPFVTSLRDTQFYTKAVEQGIGVLEIKHSNVKVDHEQWAPLLRWLDGPIINDEADADVTPLFSQHQGNQA